MQKQPDGISNLDARVGAGSRQDRGVVVNFKCRHAIVRAQLVRLHSARRLAGEARVPPEEISAFGTAYNLWPALFLHVNLDISWAEQFVSKMTQRTKRTTFGGLLTVFVRVVPSHALEGSHSPPSFCGGRSAGSLPGRLNTGDRRVARRHCHNRQTASKKKQTMIGQVSLRLVVFAQLTRC